MGGEKDGKYQAIQLALQTAQKERDDTQKELAAQLKREQDAHQQTLVHQQEIADELEAEHAARMQRDVDIIAIELALANEKKKVALIGESNDKSTKITELQTQLAELAAAKQAALVALEEESAAKTAALRANIDDEHNKAETDHEKMLELQQKLSEQLENERAARSAIEIETDQVRKERDAKELERQDLLARLREAEDGGAKHAALEAELA